jgi:tetratricopeptide (TPR) repeat protein
MASDTPNSSFVASKGRDFGQAAGLLGLVFVAYWMALRGGFLWDDDLHVTANPVIIGPLGLKEIWTTARANYFPLVLTNFWAQHQLWGLNPLGYHLVTWACHAVSAVLLWRVLRQMAVPGAWWGAAIWALHPVQVESVAWICELKNTQSAVFFLLSILFYVRWLEADGDKITMSRTRCYALALFAALLAILSKPSTVMLPIALGLVAGWRRGSLTRRDLLALVPFFLLSALAAGWTIWEQRYHSGAEGEAWNQSLLERALIAGRVVWFYLGKLAWPEPLIFIYPRWSVAAGDLWAYVAPLGLLATLGILVAWRQHRAGAALLLAGAFFVALLFPVMGFFNVYFFRYSFVGDHFQYLASIGPCALAGAGLAQLRPSLQRWGGAVLLALLVALTWRHSLGFRDEETLWRTTLERNPGAVMARINLGDTLGRLGRREEAIAVYRDVLRERPEDAEVLNDLGALYVLSGRADEARPVLERAVQLRPDKGEFHNNLGNAWRALDQYRQALAAYERAGELNPQSVSARYNVGQTLAELGRHAEAVAELRRARMLNPRNVEVLAALGRSLGHMGRTDEAVAVLREALVLNPRQVSLHNSLGTVLMQGGRGRDAIEAFNAAVELEPGSVVSRVNLGSAWFSAQRWQAAVDQFSAALKLRPDDAATQLKLAVAMVNAGTMADAVPWFESYLRLNPDADEAREQFAQVLRALGRTREALAQLELAADIRSRRRVTRP